MHIKIKATINVNTSSLFALTNEKTSYIEKLGKTTALEAVTKAYHLMALMDDARA